MASGHYDLIIIGTGPAALGAAFRLTEKNPVISILMIDREAICSGGLLNDCKQNYSYPIGFAEECWTREEAERLLPLVEENLRPVFKERKNLDIYHRRAERIGVNLFDIRQAHVGTDRSRLLIRRLMDELVERGVNLMLKREVTDVREEENGAVISLDDGRTLNAGAVIMAPGRKGYAFLQRIMEQLEIPYVDNIVDVGDPGGDPARELSHCQGLLRPPSFTSLNGCAPSAPIRGTPGWRWNGTRISTW